MKTITERALIERARRHYAKEGLILHKHAANKRDYIMNGNLYACLVDPDTNLIKSYGDFGNFIAWCRDDGILKADEEVCDGSV